MKTQRERKGRYMIRLADLNSFLSAAEECGRRVSVPDDDQPSDTELVNVYVYEKITNETDQN